MLATTVDFLKESGQVLLVMTGPLTDAIRGVQKPCTHGLANANIVFALPQRSNHFPRKSHSLRRIYARGSSPFLLCYERKLEGFSKRRMPAVNGMSFRGCLPGGGDIFSKSVEHQGGANRTFATGGRCHGWQLEPCPYGLEPLLTFRQKIPTGRPYIEEGCSVCRGRSWFLH